MRKGTSRGHGLGSPVDLTEDNREQRASTYPGMAHWGGSGPTGTRCKDCWFFDAEKPQTDLRMGVAVIRGHCRKFQELMNQTRALKFPAWAPSCRYFKSEGKK